MLRILLVSALLAVSSAATAEEPKREVAEKAADNADKMICKRFTKTGSLVDSYRACKTKREWDRERENIHQLGSTSSCRLLGEGGSC